jgi:hypothetical protein
MKKNLHLLITSFIIVFFITSCKKDHAEDPPTVPPLNDNSLPSGAVSNIKLTGKTPGTLEFTLDITVFRDSKNIENQLKPENFSMDTLLSPVKYYFTRVNANAESGSSATPYSALMLMDQSGSILSTDPDDNRIEAAKAFCSNLGQGDNVMLWSFAGSTQQKYGTGFTGNGSSLIPYIESLDGQEGGATPLYKSQYAVIDFAAANAPSANKAVMTFTDGEDTEGGYTSQQIINNAVSKNIKLYNVGLGSAQVLALSSQASTTGGAFMFAQDARQLISMFGNLGKLLNKSAQYYHTSWKVTRGSGTFSTGILSHQVRVMLPYNTQITIPFSISY